jgi:hypothetical protein
MFITTDTCGDFVLIENAAQMRRAFGTAIERVACGGFGNSRRADGD